MQEEIKIQDYGYTKGTKLEIDAHLLLSLLNFFSGIVQKETQEVLLYETPKVKNGKLEYDASLTVFEFLSQKPQSAITLLGSKALDYQMVLEDLHRKAIADGISIKNEEIGQFKLDTTLNA